MFNYVALNEPSIYHQVSNDLPNLDRNAYKFDMTEFKLLESHDLAIKFTNSIPDANIYKHKGIEVRYEVKYNTLYVEGTVFLWNWDSSFKESVSGLEKTDRGEIKLITWLVKSLVWFYFNGHNAILFDLFLRP